MRSTRREFLKASVQASTLLAFSPVVPAFISRSAQAGTVQGNDRQTILVVVQLSGGNDGLNTVIPFQDDLYHKARPTLRQLPGRVLKLNSQLGFHPEMRAFQRLHEEGGLSIVQGVGYPSSKRDHPTAMKDWHTAKPKEPDCQTGWMGRTIDRACGPGRADVPGMFVGNIAEPLALQTENVVVPSLRRLDQWTLTSKAGAGGRDAFRQHLVHAAQPDRAGTENPLLNLLRQTTVDACSASQRIEAAGPPRASSGGGYPEFRFAQTLQSVAQLIRADVGVRIYFTELGGGGIGGFDSHANQAANHGVLLRELTESVAAFIADLRRDKLHDRVLLMTFSEFGRTVAENGRHGTDHGAAAPVFLAGGRLKGGLVGSHPSLRDLDGGGLKFRTDFREVYATVLDRWLGFVSQAVLGGRFQPLDVLAV